AGWSVSNGSMCYNFIKDIEMPEGTTNSYGIALSQRTSTGPDETYPRCSNVRVSYNHIENVPWEGLDTHSGERIIFTNNNVISCGCGIAVVCVDTNPDRGAPHHCIVANNIIDVGDAEVIRPAISLGGADDGTSAYNVVEYARGCVIANNQIKGYPRPDSSYDGAIRVNNTIGLTITGGVLYEPVVTGIILGHNNVGFNISG